MPPRRAMHPRRRWPRTASRPRPGTGSKPPPRTDLSDAQVEAAAEPAAVHRIQRTATGAEEEPIAEDSLEFDPTRTDAASVFVEPPPDPQWTAATGSFKADGRGQPGDATRTWRWRSTRRSSPRMLGNRSRTAGQPAAREPGRLGAAPSPEPSAPAPEPALAIRRRPRHAACRRGHRRMTARRARIEAAAAATPVPGPNSCARFRHAPHAQCAAAPQRETCARVSTRARPRLDRCGEQRRAAGATALGSSRGSGGPWPCSSSCSSSITTAMQLAASAALRRRRPPCMRALGVQLSPHWDLSAYDVRQLGRDVEPVPARMTRARQHQQRASMLSPCRCCDLTLQDRFGNRVAARDLEPRDVPAARQARTPRSCRPVSASMREIGVRRSRARTPSASSSTSACRPPAGPSAPAPTDSSHALKRRRPCASDPTSCPSPLVLAPMAGVTDRPFRILCRSFGAGLAASEMLTADTRLWNTAKSRRRMTHEGEPEPRIVQLAGADPQMLAEAARAQCRRSARRSSTSTWAVRRKRSAASCAARRCCATSRWSHASSSAVVRAVSVPVTLKIRTGWDREHRNGVTIARIAEASGVAGTRRAWPHARGLLRGRRRVRNDPRHQVARCAFRCSRMATSIRRRRRARS